MSRETKQSKKIKEESESLSQSMQNIDAEILDSSKELTTQRRIELGYLKENHTLRQKILELERHIYDQSRQQAKEKKESLKNETNDLNQIIKLTSQISSIEKDRAKFEKDRDSFISKAIKQGKITQKQAEDLYNRTLKGYDVAKETAENEKERLSLTEEQIKLKEKLAKLEQSTSDQIKKSLGFLDDIDTQIKSIPVVGGALSDVLGIDKLKEEITGKLTETIMDSGGLFKDAFSQAGMGVSGLKAGLMAIGPVILSLLPIIAGLTALKTAFDLEKESVELATNLDISKEAAIDLHHEIVGIAQEINQIEINSKEVAKAMSELRTLTGYNLGELAKTNDYALNLLSTTTLLAEKQGLTTEEAIALNSAALITGTNVQNMAMMAASMGDEFVSGKQLMQDIGKVSKSVLINFKNNPIELVKAVKKAKMLGIELDSINDAGDDLLSIESSLQSEMQANILAGKQMNFNEARQAALAGDTAKLQEEITKQIGDAAAYTAMEPYKRKAIADAAGLTVEQLDNMMTKQLELDKLGYDAVDRERVLALSGSDRAKELERIKSMKGAEAAQSLEAMYAEQDRVDSMSKLADVGTKLMDIMGEQLGPVVEMVSLFGDLASVVIPAIGFALKVALFPFKALTEGIKLFTDGSKTIVELWNKLSGILQTFLATFAVLQTAQLIYLGYKERELIMSKAQLVIEEIKAIYGKAKIAAETAYQAIQSKGLIQTIADAAMTAFKSAAAVPFIGPALGAAAAAGAVALGYSFMDDGVMSPVGPAGYSRVLSSPEGSIALNDKDTLVAGTDLNQGGSGGNNGEVVALLKELIAKIDQPVHINIGNRAVTELEKQTTMTRRFKTSMEQGYGLHG